MSRRSDRIKRLRVDGSTVSATLTGEDGSDAPELQAIGDGGDSDLEVEEQPTQKTRAKKGTRSMGRVGKLHNMLDMPLDVILEVSVEVSTYLQPSEVLINLSLLTTTGVSLDLQPSAPKGYSAPCEGHQTASPVFYEPPGGLCLEGCAGQSPGCSALS